MSNEKLIAAMDRHYREIGGYVPGVHIECLQWQPKRKGAKVGEADFRVTIKGIAQIGLVGCTLFCKEDGATWWRLPARGNPGLGYESLIHFDHALNEAFQEGASDAVMAYMGGAI